MELKIDHKSTIPLHFQVEELLRKLIELPEYKNGDFLPKEIELAKKLGISRNTIRQATNKLENEGLLIRKKGVGTKVYKYCQCPILYMSDWNESGIRRVKRQP